MEATSSMRQAPFIGLASTEGSQLAGQLVWWRLSGDARLTKLTDEWHRAALDPALLPNAVEPEAALRAAMQDLAGPHRLVRKRAGAGHWALVDEEVREGYPNRYDEVMAVRLSPTARLKISRTTSADQKLIDKLHERYEHHLDALSPAVFSGWLVRMVGATQGLPVTEGGRLYFLPRHQLQQWEEVVGVVQAATDHRVHSIRAFRTDAAGMRGVLDAVQEEAEKRAAEFEAALADVAMGELALRNREQECRAAEARASMFEDLLGGSLAGVKQKLERLRAGLAQRALTMMADEEEKHGH